ECITASLYLFLYILQAKTHWYLLLMRLTAAYIIQEIRVYRIGYFLARQGAGRGKSRPYFLRFAISSSVVPVVINSYNKAWPTLGRRIRPRRWMYSRLVLLPLTIIATRQSGTSTPSLSTRPVTSLVYCPARKRSRMVRRSSAGVL